jgi:hypothetical protein
VQENPTDLLLQYTINSRVKSFFHGGRVLKPLLYLHIYPCEKVMNKETLTAPNIKGRLDDYYKHTQDELVRDFSIEGLTLIVYCKQLCNISVFLNHTVSLKNMRLQALDWMRRYPQSAVLVVLEGHTTVQTGEIVYAPPGSQVNHHAQVTDVSSFQRT